MDSSSTPTTYFAFQRAIVKLSMPKRLCRTTLRLDSGPNRDLPLIEACVFAVALMTMVINLLVDLSCRYLDPRVEFV